MVAIAAAVLVAFIGGLYFITHHKKEEAEALKSRQVTGNGLPPKPVSYTHLTLPTNSVWCRSRWSPYH